MMKDNRVEEVILVTVSLLALVGGLLIKNELFSYVMIGLLVLCAILILGRHLPDFAHISADNPKVKTMRFLNWFVIGIVLLGVGFSFLLKKSLLTGFQEKWLSFAFVILLMVVIGNLAPKIPFNRYMGLRLPWTVRDEETWIAAHRILGYITFPLVICFIVLSQFFEMTTCIIAIILTWVLIPAIFSGIFFMKKFS